MAVSGKLLLALFASVLAAEHAQIDDQTINDMLNNLPPRSPCHCVAQDQCIKGLVATAGQGKYVLRNGSPCSNGEVCCELPKATTVKLYSAIAATAAPRLSPSVAIPSQIPNGGTETTTKKDDITCGRRLQGGYFFRAAKSSGPKQAGAEEFPWTVAVHNKIDQVYIGVGSLIHPRAVLTVAHHYFRREAEQVRVRAGVWDRTEDGGAFQSLDSDVNEIVTHKDFHLGLKAYDVALLFLTTAIAPGPNIGFACLPPTNLVPARSTICIVTGWGSNELGGALQKIQKMIELPIWDRESCQEALRLILHVSPRYLLPQSMMCAGGVAGADTCVGDGGAPLVCAYSANSTRYYQAGITSWGVGCGEAGRPAVYTSVAHVRRWVDQQMQARQYGTETYTPPDETL